MLKVVLVLLYLYSGEVKLELHSTASLEDCQKRGMARIEAQYLDPKFDGGLFADCLEIPVVEARVKE